MVTLVAQQLFIGTLDRDDTGPGGELRAADHITKFFFHAISPRQTKGREGGAARHFAAADPEEDDWNTNISLLCELQRGNSPIGILFSPSLGMGAARSGPSLPLRNVTKQTTKQRLLQGPASVLCTLTLVGCRGNDDTGGYAGAGGSSVGAGSTTTSPGASGFGSAPTSSTGSGAGGSGAGSMLFACRAEAAARGYYSDLHIAVPADERSRLYTAEYDFVQKPGAVRRARAE